MISLWSSRSSRFLAIDVVAPHASRVEVVTRRLQDTIEFGLRDVLSDYLGRAHHGRRR